MLCNFAWQRVRRCPLDDKVIRAKAEHRAAHGGWRGQECRIRGGVEWVADLPPLASHARQVVTVRNEGDSSGRRGTSSRAADSTATGLSDSGSRWSDRLTGGGLRWVS
ncbi:hypothetical protein ALC60_01537 [Trachymyrmex zeteki]|uniref:Uncharacterized protein n=1 Tax=Mycetomoellerius zeteki TaxID=64791 RepID=A0A151XGM1_9HYME|nr:hypothetical protein ALC60_01537 [Trachymyrmex zeteki]